MRVYGVGGYELADAGQPMGEQVALIRVNRLADRIIARRRLAEAPGAQHPWTSTPAHHFAYKQLISAAIQASIINPPGGPVASYDKPVVTARITEVSLNRDTGTVSGALITEGAPVAYTPQFVRTAKGQATVRSDGTVTYTPWPGERRAATRPGAGFRGADSDTLTLAACKPDGMPVRVRVSILIFGR